MRPIVLVLLTVLAASMIIIPAFFVFIFNEEEIEASGNNENVQLQIDPKQNVIVTIYRSNTKTIESYPLEEYVRGVVAAEMPVEFEQEALQAQAIAARTYIVKRIIEKSYTDVPEGAMVTDTVSHQVFLSEADLKKKWGFNYEEKIAKLNKAVNETSGQVITYNNRPIDALYFSTSNGFTENSEEYWMKEVQYLRSVESSWDKESPKFNATKFVPYTEIETKLNVDASVLASSGQDWIKILSLTEGNRVKELKIGEMVLSGREAREYFDLNSSDFTWQIQGDGILFYTKGFGHGVGMSQYGANGMAEEGKTAEEIINHYYSNVEITNIDQWIKVKN